MQRQAVPLIKAEAPLVGTGMEEVVARDFGRRHRRAPHRRRRPGGRHPHRHPRDRGDRSLQAGRRHLPAAQVPALQPEHLHQPAAAGDGGRSRAGRRHHRRRAVDGPRRSGARQERARRVHAVDGLQFRGLHPALRARRVRRHLHLDPHRGVRGDGARHQARPRGDHARHPQRLGGGAQEPRRGRHRLHRRRGEPGRHPGRQDHAQGREPDDAGGEAAARHLRREGLRRARHVAAAAAGRQRHGRRGARLQSPRRREGRARHGDRARGDRAPRQGPRRRAADPRPQRLRAPEGRRCMGKEAAKGPKNARKGTIISEEVLADDAAQPVVGDRAHRRGRHGRGRGDRQAVRGRQEEPGAPLRRQGRQAAARRRAASRRHEDGQGLRGREAQDPAGRQDGRPARQQGRGVDDRARRGHALPGGRHARRRGAQSAGRAEPHERRADPRDASGLGLPRPRPHHRRGAAEVPRERPGQGAARHAWSTSTARTATASPS